MKRKRRSLAVEAAARAQWGKPKLASALVPRAARPRAWSRWRRE
jgi:hypothetical protein